MNKHTPGPWKFMYRKPIRTLAVFRNDGTPNDAYLATVFPDDVGTNEAEANARLIAAAPEMLEVLIAARELIKSIGLDASPLHAVIAKATGETT